MKSTSAILNKIIVRNWYAERAGLFFFLFVVFFGAVAPSMQLAYHYSLIRGMLEVPVFMGLVAGAWLGYAAKTREFVYRILSSPEYLFMYKLLDLPPQRLYGHFLRIQLWLMLPIWGYALAVAGVAWQRKLPAYGVGVLLYVILLVVLVAAKYTHRLMHPGQEKSGTPDPRRKKSLPYWSVLARFLIAENKGLLTGIKLFGCLTLYAMLRTQTPDDYDLRLPYFVFSLAMFGHGLLIYRCRELETTRLLWYRNLPVPRLHRFIQIALFCGLLLIPELLILAWLTPDPIRIGDSMSFILSGYSVVLLLYTSAATVAMGDYLKLCLVLFGILYVAVLSGMLIGMSGLFLATACWLFWRGY